MGEHVEASSPQPNALVDHLVQGYRSGRSLTQLSGEIGRSYGYVRRLLLDAGVTLRPRGGAARDQRRTSTWMGGPEHRSTGER